jgi:eukaryotic-like serine/threonine-protein kinase
LTAPQPTADLVGKIVDDRYQVLALLGTGGMCVVYRAEDLRSSSQVAIKVLPAERAENVELAARFVREAAAGKRISHVNVCSISNSGSLRDGSLYLVMELLDGEPLDRLLARGRIPLGRAVDIAQQVLRGLGAAHQLGMTHRDVKPDNVMLVGERAKLVDFGIASNDRAAFKLTAAGLAFGTPEYISPEMAMGLQTDPRADLYSVGVVLFQMVAGRLPFEARDTKAMLRAHIETPPPSARSLDRRVPPELDAVIRRALAKLPEERFPTAEAMIDALARARPSRVWIWIAVAAALLALLAALFRLR